MKQRITSHLTIALWLLLYPLVSIAQVHPGDSLELVNLYNATCNQGCTLNWDLTDTSTWEGVELNQDRVVKIRLDSMNLTGSIPDLDLPHLTHLHLFSNNLSGNIPNFNNLTTLKELHLISNQLEGSIPNLENQVNLTHLRLGDNRLTGEIPNLDHMTNLRVIRVGANQISGSMPNFSNNPKLVWIDVSSNIMSGTIANFNLPNLVEVDFAFNNFSGPVPSFEFTAMRKINLGSNQFTGPIPDFSGLTDIYSIRMYSNKLTGPIPNFNLPELTELLLFGNQLRDSIPDFNHLTKLETLYLQSNQLIGTIPNFNLPVLRILRVQGNDLTGTIPDFADMPELSWLDLSSNKLVGPIPDFPALPNLALLFLKKNKFSFDDIQNAKTVHDNLPIFEYSPQFHGTVQAQILEIGDTTLLTLSNPLPGAINDNVMYQWLQNGDTLIGSIDSTYEINSLELSQVGKYTLHMTDTTRVPDLEIISEPIYIYVQGYDLLGQPVVNNQIMIEFTSKEEKNAIEEEYLISAGVPVDSCSCNRLLYLWEFPNEVDMLEVLLALNTKTENQTGRARVSGLNNKFQLSLSAPGEGWTWTGNYPGNYPDTVNVYMLDSGLDTTNWNDDRYLIPSAPLDSCRNNLSSYGYNYADTLTSITSGASDSMGHGFFGAYSMVDGLPENINIKIIPLKVFDDTGAATLFNFICGLYHAIDHGADIINVSAGYYGEPSEILEDAIALAQKKGVFIIAATGNDSLSIDNTPQYPAYYAGEFFKEDEDGEGGEWIHFDNVKSVTSVGPQDTISDFANFGVNTTTLAAYGEDMGGYLHTGEKVSLSGTSVATFYVTRQLAIEMAKNKNRSYQTVWNDFEVSSLRPCPATAGLTQTGKALDINLNEIYGDFKVFLEGAYQPSTQKMNTTLNTQLYLLPGQLNDSTLNHSLAVQPYNFAPFYYDGNEAVSSSFDNYPPEVVDWVLISLRTDTNVDTQVSQTAAWVGNDGQVQLLKPLFETTDIGYDSVYVVIEHRNHMGVMSPKKVSIQRNIIAWDFIQQNSYTGIDMKVGTGQIELHPNIWAMVAGDGNQVNDLDGYDVNGNDKIFWQDYNGNFYQYLPADYNMDGDVNGNDKAFWESNNGRFSIAPR